MIICFSHKFIGDVIMYIVKIVKHVELGITICPTILDELNWMEKNGAKLKILMS